MTMAEDHRNVSVLVVEDDETIASMIHFIVQREGYRSDIVIDPENALDIYKRIGHDIILLDLSMPKVNGFDLIRRFRSFGDPRIIIVSGSSEMGIKARCIIEGASDFIEKPIWAADLRERITFHLRASGKLPTGPGAVSNGHSNIPA